jgi:sarcosine oxidase subunit alpha
LRFSFEGREYGGFAGDTLASALLANGVRVVCSSPLQGRPRGVMTAGVEEPCAFVEVSAPWVDPIVAATSVDLVDGLVAAGRDGKGRLPGGAVEPAGHRYAHVETLVVGGGPAGQAAAKAAATGGDRVLLVDERGLGAAIEGVTTMERATAIGVYDDGFVVVHERGGDLWHVRARRVVLATGAHERPIAFADDDLPGVMLASAVRRYVEDFGVVPGSRAVVFATNGPGLEVAETLVAAGVEIAGVFDARRGEVVAAAQGRDHVEAVTVRDGEGVERQVDCDLVAVSGGWNPVTQLWRAIGGGLRYDEMRACFLPDGKGPSWLSVVGTAAGEGLPPCQPLWFVAADDLSRHYVDFQRDQTVADILATVDGGLRSVEHVKRATYIGTALDQGRTSGMLTAEIVNLQLGWDAGAQGPTNARPPYTPVSFGTLAGPCRGDLLDPVRTTPLHESHVERGAIFENVGQWKRPWYFPASDREPLEGAVVRECLAVRREVGAMDASTLGNIEVVGPDAAAFLDRMYANRMSTLEVGKIRYGMLCGLDGMVFDDGVVMRLADDRFFVTTTTGGAAKVLDHFEEWLQTELPEMRAYCTSATEQWSTIAVNGPRARDILATIGMSTDLAPDAFPFMTWRNGEVAGVPARVARVSFSGELAYEINVAGWHGRGVWEAVLDAGAVPYGTEAMHVLRAEKGFVIVGQETDGTVTPHDLGMSWMVRKDESDFVGKRSLRRADLVRQDRKQLVGLLPADPEALLPEGAQLVVKDTGVIPMPMIGHVTSSYRSAALGRTFALAMVNGGRGLIGRELYAPLPDGTISAVVTEPVFYDKEGARRDG